MQLKILSYMCKWVKPKESNTKIADAVVYGRKRKHILQAIEEFDPRPPESIGTANMRLTEFLESMQGKCLGVSSLFDVGSSSASASEMHSQRKSSCFLFLLLKRALK